MRVKQILSFSAQCERIDNEFTTIKMQVINCPGGRVLCSSVLFYCFVRCGYLDILFNSISTSKTEQIGQLIRIIEIYEIISKKLYANTFKTLL